MNEPSSPARENGGTHGGPRLHPGFPWAEGVDSGGEGETAVPEAVPGDAGNLPRRRALREDAGQAAPVGSVPSPELGPRRRAAVDARPRHGRGSTRHSTRTAVIASLVVGVVVVSAAAGTWIAFEGQIRAVLGLELSNDFVGAGTGEPHTMVISSGAGGEEIANALFDAGVTKSFAAFFELLLAEDARVTIQPGNYLLRQGMSAHSALEVLREPSNRVPAQVVISAGSDLPAVFDRLAANTGIAVGDFEAASADLAAFGLPAEAPSLEGYLFAGSYSFDPELGAKEILRSLVNRTFSALDDLGIAPERRNSVLTMASLVQLESGRATDFPRVAGILQARADSGLPLESEVALGYGAGIAVFRATESERADANNRYNTFIRVGEPLGPVTVPSAEAITAVLNPERGEWLSFSRLDGQSGKMAFSSTEAEQQEALQRWRMWLDEHPDWKLR